MQYLKQSTAVTLKIGPFLDETDGKTAETGLTIAQADVRLSKNGGNIAQKTEATSCTHDELGIYGCPIDATDTATLGRLQIFVHESGALPVFCEFLVVTANVYDTLCSTDQLDVNVTNVAGTSQTANDNGADINAILVDTGTTLDTLIKDIPTVSEFEARSIVAANYVVVGDTIAGVTLCTTCTTNTDMVGTDGANTVVPDAAGVAATPAEVATALTDIHLDHLLAADYDPASKPGVATALLNEIVESDAGVSRFTENSLEQAPSGTGASAATIADAVWDELQADHVGAGTFGITASEIAAIPTTAMRGTDDAALATGVELSAQGKLDVNAEADTALSDMFTSSAQLVDDIWDEVLTAATHNVANSSGKRVRDIGAYAIVDGTSQAGTAHSITLAAGSSAINGTYNRNLLVITGGTGVGQSRTIVDYNGTSKVAVVSRDWKTNPDNTSEYQVTAYDTPLVVDNGVAQAGGNDTITLRAVASAVNDIYVSCIVTILAGTGRGQARLVNSYVGATKVVTVCNNWATNPDATSVYAMMPYGASRIGCMSPESLVQVNSEVDTCLSDYDGPTNTEFEARSIVSADYVVVGDTIAGVTTCTNNSDMRGTDSASLATGVQLSTQGKLDVNAEGVLVIEAYDGPTNTEFEARSDLAGTAATPAEVATALTDIHLDHLFAVTYDPASKPGAADALLNEIIENDAGVSRYTSNALEQAPSGSGATAAEVRIEIDANSTKLASIETDTKGISDTACSADGASPTTNSLADIVRKMKWFVANLWEIDENATPDTFKIFKDDNLAVGLNFTVYTDSSKSYRDNTP